MGASDYLRAKFQRERHLALSLQNGFNSVMQSAEEVSSTIYSGVERLSWYSSCFIPGYDNVCKELLSEELRTFYSINSLFKHHDIIRHMLFLYFQSVCEDIKEGNPGGAARKLLSNSTYLAGSTYTAKMTRHAFAYSLSAALAQSEIIQKTVVQRLAAKTHIAVQALHLYGFQQKAVLSARKLKAADPDYYWILYQANMEMLYYFIEPALAEIMNKVKQGTFNNLDELTSFIRGKYDV
ncbi:hypothetical protein CYR55_17315 [Chimaeribacter californicus]|uniref:Uncharacterized protein n=2 Tax=Chimaeribacter californicus TaxID=2060067 RepID=A0A2N5DZT7_9GAMM|nr:hypothetical protein CYR55_17315 [Chimaeribacter californicus]